ncbi:MAG TPA: Trm112 family protein [Pseudomonadales bacterium]|nr:Trm112 family protein [Pseudomonadales bacterium]
MDRELLAILVCPVSKASLVQAPDGTELLCAASGLAYPVRDGIPVLLADEARELSTDELAALRRRGGAPAG